MTNLRMLVRQRLMKAIAQVKGTLGAWKILVCDEFTEKMIVYACGQNGMNEIMQAGGVESVERLRKKKRKPYPHKEAIYFVRPTRQVVASIFADYEGVVEPELTGTSKAVPRYKGVHLILTAHMPSGMQEELQQSGLYDPRAAHGQEQQEQSGRRQQAQGQRGRGRPPYVRSVDYVELEMIAQETRVFHFDHLLLGQRMMFLHAADQSYLDVLAGDDGGTLTEEIAAWDSDCRAIARRLSGILTTMGEYPHVRYQRTSASTQRIAQLLQRSLDIYREEHPTDYPARSMKARSVLLLLDRAHDPVAPLIHDFYYQAMVYDLLDDPEQDGCIVNDVYTYMGVSGEGSQEKREIVISEDDEIWKLKRHMHIKDATAAIADDFQKFIKDNAMLAKLDKHGKVETLSEMSDALKQLPAYQEKKSQYSFHMHMADKCMDTFRARQLPKMGFTEQDLATGVDPDGEHVPSGRVKDSASSIFKAPGPTGNDKLRLLLMMAMYFNMRGSQVRKACKSAGIAVDADFAVEFLRRISCSFLYHERKKQKKVKVGPPEERPYDLSRWRPRIGKHLKNLANDRLNEVEFPFITTEVPEILAAPAQDERSTDCRRSFKTRKQPSWAARDAEKLGEMQQTASYGKRIFAFVVGGISYNETRVVYEASEGKDCDAIIGSTSIVTANQFLDSAKGVVQDVLAQA
mmetsp:Transcript_14537/g.57105  ORF Transcript_14537/g.57105 Transcript_14537/m.57105 type:complete len:687 (+) Transcript_14537:34-2094(+)